MLKHPSKTNNGANSSSKTSTPSAQSQNKLRGEFTAYGVKILGHITPVMNFYDIHIALELLNRIINWYCDVLLGIANFTNDDNKNIEKYRSCDREFWTTVYNIANHIHNELEKSETKESHHQLWCKSVAEFASAYIEKRDEKEYSSEKTFTSSSTIQDWHNKVRTFIAQNAITQTSNKNENLIKTTSNEQPSDVKKIFKHAHAKINALCLSSPIDAFEVLECLTRAHRRSSLRYAQKLSYSGNESTPSDNNQDEESELKDSNLVADFYGTLDRLSDITAAGSATSSLPALKLFFEIVSWHTILLRKIINDTEESERREKLIGKFYKAGTAILNHVKKTTYQNPTISKLIINAEQKFTSEAAKDLETLAQIMELEILLETQEVTDLRKNNGDEVFVSMPPVKIKKRTSKANNNQTSINTSKDLFADTQKKFDAMCEGISPNCQILGIYVALILCTKNLATISERDPKEDKLTLTEELATSFSGYFNDAINQICSPEGFYNVTLTINTLHCVLGWYIKTLNTILGGEINQIELYETIDRQFWSDIKSITQHMSNQLSYIEPKETNEKLYLDTISKTAGTYLDAKDSSIYGVTKTFTSRSNLTAWWDKVCETRSFNAEKPRSITAIPKQTQEEAYSHAICNAHHAFTSLALTANAGNKGLETLKELRRSSWNLADSLVGGDGQEIILARKPYYIKS